MFRAVFETAVERAEENPGLVDSEDLPRHNPFLPSEQLTPLSILLRLLLGFSTCSWADLLSSLIESNYQQLPPSSSSSNSYSQRVYHPQVDTTNHTPINHHHPLLHLLTQPIQSHTHRSNIKNQFGSESYFDAVLVYFNNNQGDGVIIIVRSHEMRDMRKEEIYKIDKPSEFIDSDQAACPGLPSNCYSEEFLNGLKATHKLSLSIQKFCVQLDQHIFSITPQHILAEANVHP
ncbi:hypothetical protein BY996DRAFT_6509420 [Phakopsora pachyrhizi]|nr:hypothetical protein BY996DRAFT_6509420 [Phakopsora pachyrhizi]